MSKAFRATARATLLSTVLWTACGLASAADWKWTAERVADYARVGSVQISPDGSRVLYTVTRPRPADAKPGPAYANLWLAPFGGGTPRPMTSADTEDRSAAWSPDGGAIAFLSARDGEESKSRVWLMAADGGEARPITDPTLDAIAFAWEPHGRSIAYVAIDPKPDAKLKEEKAGRDWVVADHELRPRRLRIVELNGLAASSGPAPLAVVDRPVAAAGDRSVWEFDWSPDGRFIAATVSDTPRTDDSYMRKKVMALPIGLDGAQAKELMGIVGKVDQVAWSKDGGAIALRAGVDSSDPYSGSLFVLRAPGAVPGTPAAPSGPAVNLTKDQPESVNRIEWLPEGRLASIAVAGTRTSLSLVDPARPAEPAKHRPLIAPGPEVFTSASWSADGRRLALAAATAADPGNVYVGERGSRGAVTLRRITDLNPDLAAMPRGRQETFKYAASDGTALEAILIRPVEYPGHAAYPLVVIAHGGPESQYLDGWNTSYSTPAQALAERGYFVLLPNYRGSTGRGVAFAKADHLEVGGREFTDVLDGIDALAARFPIDRKRVGITGGSYGGYFTALGVTRHSDRFAAGVELFGITNWISFLGQTDIPAENSEVHWALWCYEHAEDCWQASPIAHIGKAGTPTLILQGDKDERVPKPQSDELYMALRWKGVPTQYVVFPREKHGFRERAHQMETFDRMMAWFEKYLKP